MNIIFAQAPKSAGDWALGAPASLALHKILITRFDDIVSKGGCAILGFASFGDIGGLQNILDQSSLKVDVAETRKFDVNWYCLRLSHPA